MPLRCERLSKQFQREISDIINRDMKDRRLGFVTVTNVKMNKDLAKAVVFVSVLGDDNLKEGTLGRLKRASGFIRREVARRVTMKFMPEIEFELDSGIEQIERTLSLIDSLEKRKKIEKQ